MNGKIRLALCGVLTLALLLWAAPVLAVPPIPHAFYGTVKINNADAPRGTVVSAKINGENAGSYTTTVVGQYGSLATRSYLAVGNANANDGDTITFYVKGVSTSQTSTFEVAGGPTEKNLTVTIAPPARPDEVGAVGPPPTYVETTLFGIETDFRISDEGEILKTIEATSADGMLTITIPKGTIALDEDGDPLEELEASIDESPPDPPEGAYIIGLAYDFGPDGATFAPPITFTWSYDPDALPEGVSEEDLVLAYYDEEAGEWVEVDCVVDTENNIITASVSHFTTFAIIGAVPPAPPAPAPAAFTVSTLTIRPAEVEPKEAVTITVSVANTGGTEGIYTVVLKINGVKEVEQSVTIAAGSSEIITFSVTREEAGSYSVTVDGLSSSFVVAAPPVPPEVKPPVVPPEVKPPINWPLIGGIIAAVVVVGLLIFFLVVRRRAY